MELLDKVASKVCPVFLEERVRREDQEGPGSRDRRE